MNYLSDFLRRNMSYQVLERDEHGYATHTIDNGNESWYQNYYNEEHE